MTFPLIALVVNLVLMALYCTLVHPFLSITYHRTSKNEELEKHHKKLTNTLLVLCGVLIVLLFITIYAQTTYLLVGVFLIIMYMTFITLWGIGVYRKHRVRKETEVTGTEQQ